MTDQTEDLPKFEFIGLAEIKHLNIRKDGPEEDKRLAVDCKMAGDAPASLCDFFDAGLRNFFWDYSESGAIARNEQLSPVGFTNVVMNVDLEIETMMFHGVSLKNFVLKPKDGEIVILSFSATFYPTEEEAGELAAKLANDVSVRALPQPGLFDQPEPDVKKKPKRTAADAGIDNMTISLLDSKGNTVTSVDTNLEKLKASTSKLDKIKAHLQSTNTSDRDITEDYYADAVALVRKENKASISLVQRHLKLGYNMAARIVERMEKNGVVTPAGANGQREVLPA